MEGTVTWSWVLFQLVVGLITLAAVFLGGFSLKIAYVYRKFAHIPSPARESFFFGHGLEIVKKIKAGVFFAEVILQMTKEVGHTFVLFVLGSPLVITVEQEAVKELLVTGNFPKATYEYGRIAYLYGTRFMGSGLVTETITEKWSKRHAAVNPAFHRQLLRTLLPDFNQTGNDLMDNLAVLADGKTVIPMLDRLSRATLDVIGKIAFGLDINSLGDPSSPFPAAIFKTLTGFSESNKSLFTSKIPFINRKFKNEVRDAIKLLRETGAKVLDQREKDEQKGIQVPTDVISFVITARKNDPTMDVEEILDDFVTFFIAGQETTSNALGFIIQELGRHPDILKRVREEVDEVIGERHDIQFEDINKLEFMSMVIKETLRLYPVVPLTFRELHHDHTLGEYSVPKGTTIVMSQYASARQEDCTPDCLTFDPDRFLPDSDRRPPTYSFFPFALGPRSCIGITFAQIEVKIILAKFVQRFNYDLAPNQSFEISENTTLKPKSGTRVILTERGA